jgi:hypothetical protein
MKKIIATLALVCVVAANCFAPDIESRTLPPGLSNYIATFSGGIKPRDASKSRISIDYFRHAQGDNNRNAVAPFAKIEGDPARVDTALEWLYTSYYHIAVRDIRPTEAKAILPADNPKLADLTIGNETLRDEKIARFLGNTDALDRYADGIKIITDQGRVTRADIEKYYRDNIRAFIAGIVSGEFNKVSFSMDDLSADRTYLSVLTRNPQNGEYILSYYRPSIQNSGKELSAPTLDALLAEMRNGKDKVDFIRSDIDAVRAQAKLIPALTYSGAEVQTIVDELVNFYLSLNKSEYDVLYKRYRTLRMDGDKGTFASSSHYNAVLALNPELAHRMVN